MDWCVIVADPQAFRPHVMKVAADSPSAAERAATTFANLSDERAYREFTDRRRSHPNRAVAFPLDEHGRLNRRNPEWPVLDDWMPVPADTRQGRLARALIQPGDPLPFLMPTEDETNVMFAPLDDE